MGTKVFSDVVSLPVVFYLAFFSFSSLPVTPQGSSFINLKEIPDRKVRSFIEARSINRMEDFHSIHHSWKEGNDESLFKFREKILFLKRDLPVVWENYRCNNTTDSWEGDLVRFGLMVAKRSNSISYYDDFVLPEIDTGQIYFLNLRILRGLFNVPVAFEVISVDPFKRMLEFSYIEDNVSKGKQTLQFIDNGDGRTRIIHRTYYKSDHAFRDNVIYPYFHKRMIMDYHRNMRQKIKTRNQLITII